jgi:hypothetical protein
MLASRVCVSFLQRGEGCVPVGAPVFKIGGRWLTAGCGGFDSHLFPYGNFTFSR